MSTCSHENAVFVITIQTDLVAHIQVSEIHDAVAVTRDGPKQIRIAVKCDDCRLGAVYNAYADLPPVVVSRWPTWLLNRLVALRARHPEVHAACSACHVPPADHPSWPMPGARMP